jgi:hypothetical protein
MKVSWLTGLSDEEALEIKEAFKGSHILRKRLTEMCFNKIGTSLTTKKDQYESPNWAYMQADNLGYRRALNEIISVLED